MIKISLLASLLLMGCFHAKKVPVAAKPRPAGPTILALFSDAKASPKVGDLITVQVVENASGSKKRTSSAEKKNDLSGSLDFETQDTANNGKLGIKSKNKYDSADKYVKQGSLVANVTAIVEEVFPNGNVRIQGQQEIQLDKGIQTIALRGIARPEDISNTNTVLSTRLASAKISYKSKNEPDIHRYGLLGWLFNWVF